MTKKFRRNIERVFCCCRDLKTSWLEHFSKFNKQGVWKKMSWVGHFLKIDERGGGEGLIEKNNLGVRNINTSTSRFTIHLGYNTLYRLLTFRKKLILTCFFVFDYNISYYNTLKMKKELFVLFYYLFLLL